jgi:hypothetical protein
MTVNLELTNLLTQEVHIICLLLVDHCLVLDGFCPLSESESAKCLVSAAAMRTKISGQILSTYMFRHTWKSQVHQNLQVLKDYLLAGDTAHIIASLALPPRDSCNKKVKRESRYGM